MLAFLLIMISHAKGTRYKTSCFRTAGGVSLLVESLDTKKAPAQDARVYQVVCSHWYVTF